MEAHGPWLPITSPRTLRACKDFETRPTDVFVCSYPKSGTTWTQNVLAQIITALETTATFAHVSDVSPFFEIDPHWTHPDDEASSSSLIPSICAKHETYGRRCFNTHLPWELAPRGAKYVYVYRDGRDAAVSFYHHLRNQSVDDGGFEGGWDRFFERWIDGQIAFGSWFEHVLGWGAAAGEGADVLAVGYEEMVRDLRSVVEKIADHVLLNASPADRGPRLTEAQLDAIAAKCGFDAMKADVDRFQPRSVRWRDPEYCFIRKGVVGDHRTTMTAAQSAAFEAKAAEAFGPKGVDDAPLFKSRAAPRVDSPHS